MSGKKKKEGGVLPDDNIRIYVPLDLNPKLIMHELHNLFYSLGFVSESNEYAYSNGTYRILKLLDVYDPAWIEKENIENKTMNTHSEHAKELAQDIIQYLLCHEGQAECFPTMKWKS